MYSAEINRNNPTAFLFLIDQSGSMSDRNENGKSLAELVADSINKLLQDLVTKCSKSEGIRNYFDVGVIGYGNNGCYNGFGGSLSGNIMHKIEDIANNPLRIEERSKKMPDGAGGIIEQNIKFPVWFEPIANGGTPMCDAFRMSANELVNWCDNHPQSFPPILINITDGEPTDGDPEELAEAIKQISTEDGNILVFNVHITKVSYNQILFADSEEKLPGENARMLFRMSNLLTAKMRELALNDGFNVNENSRGYCYNAEIVSLISFLDIGTRAANLR